MDHGREEHDLIIPLVNQRSLTVVVGHRIHMLTRHVGEADGVVPELGTYPDQFRFTDTYGCPTDHGIGAYEEMK